MTIIFSIVEQPNMEITRSHSDTVYAGTKFTLSVNISFNSLRMNIALNITWSRGKDVISSGTHTIVSPVSGSEDNYTASLTYSPITISDSGLITATISVYIGPYTSMCSRTFATDTELVVNGISFFKKNSIWLMLFSLSCRSSKSSCDYY